MKLGVACAGLEGLESDIFVIFAQLLEKKFSDNSSALWVHESSRHVYIEAFYKVQMASYLRWVLDLGTMIKLKCSGTSLS